MKDHLLIVIFIATTETPLACQSKNYLVNFLLNLMCTRRMRMKAASQLNLIKSVHSNGPLDGTLTRDEAAVTRPVKVESNFLQQNAKFILSLTERKQVSQVAVKEVIESFRDIWKRSITQVKQNLEMALSMSTDNKSISEQIQLAIDNVSDPFSGIDTAYLREKFYKDHFGYLVSLYTVSDVHLIIIILIYRNQKKFHLGVPIILIGFKVLTTDKFFYVSLLDTLKTLLSIEDVQAEVLNPHSSNKQLLGDFCDGDVYNEHPLFGSDELSLQIIGYYDELEVVNPIGSYVSTHKLGCLFFFLANIWPQFRSTLKAINMLAVGKQEDIKHYGIDEFLLPFVEDLKVLYCDGIEVEMNGNNHCFFGGLLAFLADNLVAHAVGGFKESMSFALRICRTCMITKNHAQLIFNVYPQRP